MLPQIIARLEAAAAGGTIALTAEELNELARLLAECRLLPFNPPRAGRVTPADHHWEVRATQFDTDPQLWRVDVGAGWVLDELPSIPYRRQGDPRGWTIPAGYIGPQPSDAGYSAAFLDRDLLDDLADPPWLLASSSSDFSLVPADAWPAHFAFVQATDLAGAQLYRSHVLLSTAARAPTFIAEVSASPFTRPRLYLAPETPSANFAASAGGWRELATLYLVRAASGDPAEDTIGVLQREFWSLWNALIQPNIDAPEEALLQAESVEWWTV